MQSAAEVLLATFIVIAHNVFHILPNEVPILFALFWISLRLRQGTWIAPELKRPESWWRTLAAALAAAAVMVIGSEYVIEPLASRIWADPERSSSILNTSSNGAIAVLRNLLIVWTFAAFGEEVGYRGYVLTRAADLGQRSHIAWIAAILFSAVLFGFGHFYKGPPGIVDSTFSGIVLGSVYVLSGRNLWTAILAHGFKDTVVILIIYVGWAT